MGQDVIGVMWKPEPRGDRSLFCEIPIAYFVDKAAP